MSNIVTIVVPAELQSDAKRLRLNVSAVCREALAAKVSTMKTHEYGGKNESADT